MADLLVQNAVEAVKTAIASSGSGYDWTSICLLYTSDAAYE